MKLAFYIWFLCFCLLGNSSLINAQDTLYTGLKTFYYPSGKKSSEGKLLNGKPEGIWKNYYENSNLRSVGKRTNHQLDSIWTFYHKEGFISQIITYKDGKKNGVKKSFEDNQLVMEEWFENDVKVGEERTFHANGKLKTISPYKDSKLDGNAFEYDSLGLLQELREYSEGVITRMRKVNRSDKRGLKQGLWVKLFENRKIYQEMTYKDNLLHGYLKTFYPNGELEKVEKYANGILQTDPKELNNVRMAKTYYPGAKVKTMGAFDGDIPVGLHLEYDTLGNIIASTIYEQGYVLAKGLTDAQNKKQGFWQEFYEDGSIKAEGEYLDDLKIKTWNYSYPSGSKEQSGNYVNGKPSGKWLWFYENGDLLREEEYRNGLEDGFAIEYAQNGDTLSFGEYLDGEKEGKWIKQSGVLKMQGTYKFGQKDGKWEYLFADGKKRFSGNYIQGFPEGKHTYYHENGKTQQEGTYRMGKKEGDWRKYNEDGLVIFTVTYKDGIEIKYEGVKIKPGFEPEDYEFIVEDTYF